MKGVGYLNIKCIKNSNGNGNFTMGNEYKIEKNKDKYFGDYIVTCDFIHVFADRDTLDNVLDKQKGDLFDFACCKFEVI
jgi:hypothetical protein